MATGDWGVGRNRQRGGSRRLIVRYGAIGEGWELLKEQWGTWALTSLVVLIANSVVGGFFLSLIEGRHHGHGFRGVAHSGGGALAGVINVAVMAFFVGGMFRMACRQLRGLPISVFDLLTITDVFVELVIGCVLYGLISALCTSLCFFPGLVASGLLMFTTPLIVDARLGGIDALKESFDALKGQWLRATLFHMFAAFVSGLGTLLCGVGFFFTLPIYCLSVAVLYRDVYSVRQDVEPDFKKPETGDPYF